jgi:hypothetical protein
MGLDSLLAVEIRNVLGRAFGLALPATVTFDHPSIEALARYLYVTKFGDTADRAGRDAPVSALDTIETLSDDDIDRLIAERLKAGS